MKSSLSIDDLSRYVTIQLYHFFPDHHIVINFLKSFVESALERLDFCFRHINITHYNNQHGTVFNHLYSDQYAMFLYLLANQIWKETGNNNICDKLFCLNKAINGISCMYDTQMPDIFLWFHTVGTVLGKAQYSNYFIATHNCTVGSNKGVYPVLEAKIALLPYSSIIGKCHIGKNSILGIKGSIYEKNIPENSLIFVDSDGSVKTIVNHSNWLNNYFLFDTK